VELREIVQHVDGNDAKLDNFGIWQLASPGAFINVAANGGYRCNRGKRFENLGCANVARMNDVLRPAQNFERFGAKQAVRVGDDADEDCSSQFSVLSSQALTRVWLTCFSFLRQTCRC
jgi:hypothetical protein